MYARKRMRSTIAPEISAGVMMANMPWNIAWAWRGIVAAYAGSGSTPTPLKPSQANPPNQALPCPNAIEYPTSTHCTLITPSATMLIIMVLSTLLGRTRPP